MESKIIQALVVLGVPGVALGVFYLLLRQFNFRFKAIEATWAAIITILFLITVGGITFYAIHRWTPRLTTNAPIAASPTVPRVATSTSTPVVGIATTQVWAIGGEGTGRGFFQDPRYIGVDDKGNIYVAEHNDKRRVQVFDSNGQFVNQWRAQGCCIVFGLAVDGNGMVYTLDAGSWGVSRYEGATGKPLGRLSETRGFEAIATTVNNELIAAAGNNIVRFDANGKPALIARDLDTLVNDRLRVEDIAVDGEGNIYIIYGFIYSVFKFSPEGKFLDRFGRKGDKPGQFQSWPNAIAVDGQGRIYTRDSGIQVFDSRRRVREYNRDPRAFHDVYPL